MTTVIPDSADDAHPTDGNRIELMDALQWLRMPKGYQQKFSDQDSDNKVIICESDSDEELKHLESDSRLREFGDQDRLLIRELDDVQRKIEDAYDSDETSSDNAGALPDGTSPSHSYFQHHESFLYSPHSPELNVDHPQSVEPDLGQLHLEESVDGQQEIEKSEDTESYESDETCSEDGSLEDVSPDHPYQEVDNDPFSPRSPNSWMSPTLEPTSGNNSAEDEVDGDVGSPRVIRVSRSHHDFHSLEFQLRFQNHFVTPKSSLRCPLPNFNWADSNDVWRNMVKKEENFQRDRGLFNNHPELQPRMRSILLDWLSEVCEVYRLHKETFSLAIDYVDRYLSVTRNVPKNQLQLLGISALFVAAKLEEIYPPKLSDFAYVTDSACTESDIIKQEMIMVKALKWNLTPMTTNSWLGVYLQVANIEHITDQELGFVFPQFSTHAFIQISRLCDLCLMDAGSLNFNYSVIAASAMYHHTNEDLVSEVTGYNWADLYPCIKWMVPFAMAILDVGHSPIKFFQNVNSEDCHNIQTHNIDITLLEKAHTHQEVNKERELISPDSTDLSAQLVCLLTPPDNIAQNCVVSEHQDSS